MGRGASKHMDALGYPTDGVPGIEDDLDDAAWKVACTPAFDAVWNCFSPGNQLRECYRNGFVDDCKLQAALFQECMKIKMQRDPQAKRKLYKETVEKKIDRALLPGGDLHIWEFKQPYIDGMRNTEQTLLRGS